MPMLFHSFGANCGDITWRAAHTIAKFNKKVTIYPPVNAKADNLLCAPPNEKKKINNTQLLKSNILRNMSAAHEIVLWGSHIPLYWRLVAWPHKKADTQHNSSSN